MNAISPSASTHPPRCSSAFGNLVRKECLESREMVIAGLAIFWLVPAALELIELAFEGRYNVDPFAWLLVIGAGWLYAIIAGAHTVCRDWGKAEEHFLLAQPVSPRTVVCAKLVTGAALLAGVLGIAVAWDMMLVQRTFGTFNKPEWMLTIFSAACVMVVGYVAAFAVAVMTRQMLASIVVATLVLIVWAVAPLLSSHLARFWAPALLFGDQHPTTFVPFVLVSFLMLVACAVASLYYSPRERMFRLGNKQLAWTTGLVMLTLFGVAMSEVGNSLHVRDQATLVDPGKAVWGIASTIQRDDRFATVYCDYRPDSPLEKGQWLIATFHVSDNGRIEDLRRTAIPGVLPSIGPGLISPGRLVDYVTGLAMDTDGYLVVSGKRSRVVDAHQNTELETLWRTTLSWPERGVPEVLSHGKLALPPGQRFATTVPWREERDHIARFAYLVSVVPLGYGGPTNLRDNKLYVFDWSDGSNPGPRYVLPLPQGDVHVSVRNGKVGVWTESGHFSDQRVFAADFDADHPETLPANQNWSLRERPRRRVDPWTQEFERVAYGSIHVAYGSIHVDQHGDVAYLSDVLGLRVARQTRPERWEIVGECRTSPLSMLFRLYPLPQALDDSLVIEYGWKGIVAYDVSDPANPKRIGFFNAVDLSPLDTSIFATGRYLVLREYDMITILDRPVTGKP